MMVDSDDCVCVGGVQMDFVGSGEKKLFALDCGPGSLSGVFNVLLCTATVLVFGGTDVAFHCFFGWMPTF